jgi:putative peptide zinc metalloprotease protein
MLATSAARYFVIPLSVQKEGDFYVVGNADTGDFYRFPELGLKILNMLGAGDDAAAIKTTLAAEDPETVDVDEFLNQLTDIGFIHPESQRQTPRVTVRDSRGTFNVDRRIAGAIFSPPVLACFIAVVLYACFDAIENPALRLNVNAFYIETNRTALLLAVLTLSLIQTALHEMGHMLAAARQGIKSKYGIGNRLWNIVAESDLTGLLTLPKSQRYLPMFAGLLVDTLAVALLTILLDGLMRHGAGHFMIQVIQVLILEIVITMAWQFNVFIKTDIYFVLCNYFSHPDLDRDARMYLLDILHRVTIGRFGRRAPEGIFGNLIVLRAFSLIWVFGRLLSLLILFGVFLPTIWRYIASSIQMLRGPPDSVWMACDTIVYVSISLTMLGIGMYMWLKAR